MPGLKRAGALMCAFIVLAGAASARPPAILARIGGSYDQRTADLARCADVAAHARVADLPAGHYADPVAVGDAGIGGAIGASLGIALVNLFETEKQRGVVQKVCLRKLGYILMPLTDAEAAAFARLPAAQQPAWETALLASDLGARITPLIAPAVPRLPPYRDAPFTLGGLKIDADSLAIAGPVDTTGVLVKGRAGRWRTAVLAAPFRSAAGVVHVEAEPGAVFHQVDYRPQRQTLLRPDGATWCGPVIQVAAGAAAKAVYCFTGLDDGYDAYRPSGYAWFAGPYTDGFILPRFKDAIQLAERDADDQPPMDFAIMVRGVGSSHVELAAEVRRDGRSVEVWTRRLKFDKAGDAVLPLWTRRLLVHHTGPQTVAATLDAKGDGKGWREEE